SVISAVWVPASSSALSSSGVNITYLSFSNSYPLAMSSRPTGTSSFTQKYCCLRREPQVLCSRLNEMARLASVAEKSFTGMETSPNDTVNDASDRAAILTPCCRFAGERIVIQRDFSSFCALQSLLQALLAANRVLPAVAGLRKARGRIGDAEVERMGAREFFPREWHRDRSAGGAAR